MEKFTRTTIVKDQRKEDKTLEEDARGILARLANTHDVTVDDLGSEDFPLRASDNRAAMIEAVRGEAAKLAHFTVTESTDEVVEEPVESLKRQLSPEATERTLSTLQTRFDANSHLHKGCDWNRVKTALEANPEALWSISQMEAQGHMPDVYNFDRNGFDIGTCSRETPTGARNCVYDAEAATWLREKFPDATFNGSAVEMAQAMGINLMSPSQYNEVLQGKGKFDMQTWSWLLTDEATRKAGYARSGVRADGEVFVGQRYANRHYDDGAWRGSLRVSWA